MNNPWLFTIITALGFGGWPLVARYAGLPPITTSLVVSGSTFLFVLAAALSPMFKLDSAPSGLLMLGLLAGAINGIGFIAYTFLVSNQQWASVYIPITLTLMIAIIALGGVIFFQDSVSLNKVLGWTFAAIGIWLLTKG